jgi:hypothetical protein
MLAAATQQTAATTAAQRTTSAPSKVLRSRPGSGRRRRTVADNESPVRGAHYIGRVVVQRSAPGQFLPGLLVDPAHDVHEIGDLRGSPGDCLVERDGVVLGDGPQPFHDLQVAASGQPLLFCRR